jgi:LPS-assembly protein
MRRGAAFCVGALLVAAPALAQQPQPPTSKDSKEPPQQPAAAPQGKTAAPPTQRAPGKGSEGPPLAFSADEVQYDEDLGLVVARGHVELSQNDQILLADTVTYNQRTDTITASGHVSLLQPSGDILFADYVELHDDMRDAFLQNLRMLLSDRSRLAGNTGRRVGGNRIEIRRGVYTACEPCRRDPTRAPIWQIKAERMIDDKELQLVEYYNAEMDIAGVPVLWTPYFSSPDPSVKRRSGFLAPSFGNSVSNGSYLSLPYYWVIGKDKDATVTPLFTTAGGTFVGTQYRQRLSNGKLVLEDSVTVGSKAFTNIDTEPVNSVRWHVSTTDEIDLNQNWRLGANIFRASDPTYTLRYHIPSSVDFLTSHLFAEDFGPRSYLNVSSWAFQSLETGVRDKTQPIVAPVADYQWVSEPNSLGARLSLEGNAMDLLRQQGTSTRRLSTGGDWRLPIDGAIGDRYDVRLALRADGYQSDGLPAANAATQSATTGRVFPQLALTWRYPWVRRSDTYSQIVEPVAMVAASPYGSNPGKIPNEDSQGFEFDETSLFLPNRFPGFDRVDSGQRVDYGLKTGIYGDGGGSTRLLVGQSYALQTNNSFLPGSGLEHHLSDVVGRVTFTPIPPFDLTYRFRLDHADLALRRQEISGSVGPSNLRVTLSYIQIDAIPDVPQLQKRKQLAAIVNAGLTRYWSLQLLGTRDFSATPATAVGQTVGTTEALNTGVTLTYRDECVAFVTSVTQSGIRNGDVVPGTSVIFTIVLKNLGDIGAKVASLSGF